MLYIYIQYKLFLKCGGAWRMEIERMHITKYVEKPNIHMHSQYNIVGIRALPLLLVYERLQSALDAMCEELSTRESPGWESPRK